VIVAILSDGFIRLLPVVAGVAVAQIAAATFLLTRRSHTAVTVGVSAFVKVLSIALSGLFLAVYPYLLAAPALPASAASGIEVANKVIRVGCIIGIVGGSIDIARLVVQYLRRPARTS
jgi:hypothetical protein